MPMFLYFKPNSKIGLPAPFPRVFSIVGFRGVWLERLVNKHVEYDGFHENLGNLIMELRRSELTLLHSAML